MLLPANILGAWSSTTASIVYVSPTSSGVVSGNGINVQGNFASAMFTLQVAQRSVSSSHTLDVYIQHSGDGGVTYDDFVHFATVNGNGAALAQVAQWIRDGIPSSSTAGNFQSVRTTTTASLAAGLVLQGPVGPTWRAQAVATGGTIASSSQWKALVIANVR